MDSDEELELLEAEEGDSLNNDLEEKDDWFSDEENDFIVDNDYVSDSGDEDEDEEVKRSKQMRRKIARQNQEIRRI